MLCSCHFLPLLRKNVLRVTFSPWSFGFLDAQPPIKSLSGQVIALSNLDRKDMFGMISPISKKKCGRVGQWGTSDPRGRWCYPSFCTSPILKFWIKSWRWLKPLHLDWWFQPPKDLNWSSSAFNPWLKSAENSKKGVAQWSTSEPIHKR